MAGLLRLRCPHCALPAMSAGRKLLLGPAADRPCQACGNDVGAAVGPALLSMSPCVLLVLAVLLQVLRRPPTMVACLLVALAVTMVTYLAWVPLVRRGLTDARRVRAAQERAAG